MGLTIEVNAVDNTSLIRRDSLVVVEAAFGGEVGIGGFARDDTALGDVPAMKLVTIDESAASPTRMFTGYTSVRGLTRGTLGKVSTVRQWDVTILDLNTILDDEVFQVSSANRPEETDYARVTWALSTPALLNSLGVAAGVVPNTNTVTMEAKNYRGEGARSVFEDCAAASNKNYFIYDYGSGHKLYYDLATGTSLTSSLTLSSVLADVDNSTCFAIGDPKLDLDATGIYSAVDFYYEGGHVYVNDGGIESAYRKREVAIRDSTVKSSTVATARANAYLDATSVEKRTFTCSVLLPKAQVNDIRAGQRIQVKVPHLGISAFTYMRISRREVTFEGENYRLKFEFAEDVLPSNGGGGGGGSGGDGGGFGSDLWIQFLDEPGTSLSGFAEITGTWSIATDHISVAADITTNSVLVWNTLEPIASVVIEADMRQDSSGDYGLIVAGYAYPPDPPSGTPYGYVVYISASNPSNEPSADNLMMDTPGGSGSSPIGDTGVDLTGDLDSWHKLRVLRTGLYLSCWVDEVMVGSSTPIMPAAGAALALTYVGLWARTGEASFRNVKAWRLRLP